MEIYIHAYCRNHYSKIILDKIQKFRASGLFDAMDRLYIGFSGVRESDREFMDDLKSFSSKISIMDYTWRQKFPDSECETLNLMKFRAEMSDKNIPMMYCHTKGVSHQHPELIRRMSAWTRYLDLYTIHNWKENVEALNNHDAAGGNWIHNPSHYSGNFWWTNSNFLKTLPYLTQDNVKNLNRGELWIGLGDPDRLFKHKVLNPVNHYNEYYLKEEHFPENF